MGIFFRDKGLKETFKNPIGNDLKKDLSERIECLIKFAYKRVEGIDDKPKQKEENKKKDVGVAFIRQLWEKEGYDQQKIQNEVKNKTLLSIAKLYKIGLQANKGWFSDLPGKEIKSYALNALNSFCKDISNSPLLIYYISDGTDVQMDNRKLMAVEVETVKTKFTEDIKTLSTGGGENPLLGWYNKCLGGFEDARKEKEEDARKKKENDKLSKEDHKAFNEEKKKENAKKQKEKDKLENQEKKAKQEKEEMKEFNKKQADNKEKAKIAYALMYKDFKDQENKKKAKKWPTGWNKKLEDLDKKWAWKSLIDTKYIQKNYQGILKEADDKLKSEIKDILDK